MGYFSILTLLVFMHFYCISCDKFYYFAYGSNLIAKRLKTNCPNAQFYNVAVLEDHRLDFNKHSKLWDGAVATIVDDPGESVTGALWVLDVKDMKHLDEQEGVGEDWYFAKNVTLTVDGEEMVARTYEEIHNPPKRRACDDLPYERRPSNTYLEMMILGAVESGLPSDYIGYLVSFPTNGRQAPDKIRNELGYPFGPTPVKRLIA